MSTMSLAISGTSIRQDSNGRFCLNDLHKAAGGERRHEIANWTALQQTKDLIAELTAEKSTTGIPVVEQNQPLKVINGGNNRGTFVVKELVYAYATWISAKFFLSVIRAYDSLVSKPAYALRDLPTQNPLPNALSEILSANLTSVKKMVMLNIVNKADQNGQFQMGVLDLANLCGIAKSTIVETISSLEELGFLEITRTRASNGGSNPNLYTVPERFRMVSGELVNEPIAIEYQPPKGMMLIAESEFEALQKSPAPVVQKVEPIAAGCVVIPIKDYDKSKQIESMISSFIYQLRHAGLV